MKQQNGQTYDYICFTDLVYEFDETQIKKVEAKIKRRLKYHQLGDYVQERINMIRQLKNELRQEISSPETSVFYKSLGTGFTELNDFDISRMQKHYSKKYTLIDQKELLAMIGFAVYYFYTR